MKPGQLSPDDLGPTAGAVIADYQHGVIKLVYSHPVHWAALYPAQAREMAAALVKLADKIEARQAHGTTKPPTPSGN